MALDKREDVLISRLYTNNYNFDEKVGIICLKIHAVLWIAEALLHIKFMNHTSTSCRSYFFVFALVALFSSKPVV